MRSDSATTASSHGALKRVLGNKAMGVAEAAQAVLQSGYQTTSPSLRQIVNLTFIRSGE